MRQRARNNSILQAAGDELLVPMSDETLAGFTLGRGGRIIDPGLVTGVEVFGDDLIGVRHHLEPDGLRNLVTNEWIELCCIGNNSRLERFGDWMAKGGWGPPTIPPPDEWTNFEALQLSTRSQTQVIGVDDWKLISALGPDAIIADIGPSSETTDARYVVDLPTGERRPVAFPGTAWAVPGWPGALSRYWEDDFSVVRHLAGPDAWPRTLLEDVDLAFTTPAGHIVFTELDDGPLSVMMPDESTILLDDAQTKPLGRTSLDPIQDGARDEVLYLAEDGDHVVLRRTVLPRVGE